jgi:proteasome assembly chaperone (PAC2) family protein
MTDPSNTFYFAEDEAGRSTIIFLGEEPHVNWKRYCQILLEVFLRFKTRLIISLGGTYDERLHTDPPLVSVVAGDMVLAESIKSMGCRLGQYEGPVSIHTRLHLACRERGLAVAGLWGHAPVYVQTGNFHLVKKIIQIITALGGPGPEVNSLDEACQEMEKQIEALIEQSPKLADYINKLKSKPEAMVTSGSLLPRPKTKGKVIPLNRERKEDDSPA